MNDLERLFLAVHGQTVEECRRQVVLALIDSICSDRERLVLRWRYFDEPRKTLEECAQEVHVTGECIRQIEAQAIRRLRARALRFRRLYGICETALPHQHEDDKPIPDLPVRELELSVRTMNCLDAAGIKTIRDLCQQSPRDLLKVRNFGRKCLREVIEQLAGLRLKLNGQVCRRCLEPLALQQDNQQ
jgi:DNA-directed RNA polymerase alpha subunit